MNSAGSLDTQLGWSTAYKEVATYSIMLTLSLVLFTEILALCLVDWLSIILNDGHEEHHPDKMEGGKVVSLISRVSEHDDTITSPFSPSCKLHHQPYYHLFKTLKQNCHGA
jgi:hypothetical protein